MSDNFDLVIVGGGAAGVTAAVEARKFGLNAKMALITNEREFYSHCALPFVISGEVKIEKMAHSIEEMCKSMNIECVLDNALSVDPKKKTVRTKDKTFGYTSLILATGSFSSIPKIEGVEKEGVFALKTLEDAKKIKDYALESKSAVVVGGGAIGAEIASSLRQLNLKVTIVEVLESILPSSLSKDFSEIVAEKLKEHEVTVITGSRVEKILGDKKVSHVLVSKEKIPADMVVFGIGVKPNLQLAKDAGIKIDKGILVNEQMETSIKGIFAAGDCTQMKEKITGELILSQLGTTAIRQAEIAAVNALGSNEKLSEGIMNSLIMKIFDLQVGKTGLNENEAKTKGFDIVVGKIKTLTKEDYFPGAKELWVKVILDKRNLRVLGCEILGYENVAEKVDLIAFAIAKNAILSDIEKFDYCYTPPIIPAHNALVLAAKNAKKKLKRK